MAGTCYECDWTPEPVPINPVYEIKKSLSEVGLKGGIRFDKNGEEEYMFEKLGWTVIDMHNVKSWNITWKVIDDDNETTQILRLQKKPGQLWGFYKDWYEKVVEPRKFKGDEVIGFYIDPNTDFHFKVLDTGKGKGKGKSKGK